jgi:hypothetical protein
MMRRLKDAPQAQPESSQRFHLATFSSPLHDETPFLQDAIHSKKRLVVISDQPVDRFRRTLFYL